MREELRQYGPWLVFGAGMALVVGSDLLEPARSTHLLVTLGGGLLAFLGIVAAELRSTHGCLVDERHAAIHHRSGYFAFTVLGAMLVMTLVVVTTAELVVPLELVLVAAILLGIGSYRGSVAWFKRTM